MTKSLMDLRIFLGKEMTVFLFLTSEGMTYSICKVHKYAGTFIQHRHQSWIINLPQKKKKIFVIRITRLLRDIYVFFFLHTYDHIRRLLQLFVVFFRVSLLIVFLFLLLHIFFFLSIYCGIILSGHWHNLYMRPKLFPVNKHRYILFINIWRK